VATCAHVINSALGRSDKRDPARPGDSEVIRLRFAIGATLGDDECHQASIVGWLPAEAGTFDFNDIAVLELADSAPAHVRVLRPVRYRPLMLVQMWGPQPRQPNGSHIEGKLLGEVRDGRIQINVEGGGPFRVRPGFSGGPVWDPKSGDAAGVLTACGAEDDATDAYLLGEDRIRAAWPNWPPDREPAAEEKSPTRRPKHRQTTETTRSTRRRRLALLTLGLAAIVTVLAVVILRPDPGHARPQPPHPTPGPPESLPRPTLTHSPSPDPRTTTPSITLKPTTPLPTAPSPTRSPSPSPTVSPFSEADPYYDPEMVPNSQVTADYDGCYAWLDIDSPGDLSGILSANFESCDAEVFRSGGLTVNLAASSDDGERTSPLSDSGHTMRVCVWSQYDQADEQCSPLFGMNGDTPVQK
jgi:hypothetical protein